MPKDRRRKKADEDLDFGVTGDEEPSEDDESPEDETVDPENDGTDLADLDPEPEVKQRKPSYFADMNRIVPEDEDVAFKGMVNVDDLPKCPCCGNSWSLSEGRLAMPGCGCSIHPVCSVCDMCEPHCGGRHGRK